MPAECLARYTLYPGGYTYKAMSQILKTFHLLSAGHGLRIKHTLKVPFDTWIANTYKASSPDKAVSLLLIT